MQTYRLLLIEDNPGDVRLVKEMLQEDPRVHVELRTADNLKDGMARLVDERFDALVLDLGLPDSQGLETFTRLHALAPEMPAIVLTGNGDVDLAMCAVQAGAQDYLVKSEISGSPLMRAIRYAVERKRADEALRHSEATLRSFYENSPMLMGIIELTEDDQVVRVYDNPVATRLFPVEASGGHSYGLAAEAIGTWVASCRKSLEAGRPVTFEWVHESPAGKLWLSTHVARVGRGPSGRMQFCYVTEDITERKLAEDENRLRAAELQRSNAELREFNRLSIGRELRMVELKREVNDLRAQLGKAPRYQLDFANDLNAAGDDRGSDLAGTGRTR